LLLSLQLLLVGTGIALGTNPDLGQFFQEPMVPLGQSTTQEQADLQSALSRFADSKSTGKPHWNELTAFLSEHPQSPWRVSLLLNLGEEFYQNGYFSRALEAWRQSWEAGKSSTDPNGQAVANRAVAQLLRMLSRVGRVQDLKALLHQVEGRNFRGSTAELVQTARESLWMMEHHPEITYRCGPHALERILLYTRPQEATPLALVQSASSTNGIPLTDVAALSKAVKLNYRMAKRSTGAHLPPPPFVVHWTVNHYGAVLKCEQGRYLLDDPTFGDGLLWIAEDALDSESDGYFLIPEGSLPKGWTAVDESEGAHVWGRGYPGGNMPGSQGPGNTGINPSPNDPNPGGQPEQCGLARWNVFLMMADLEVSDSPLGYVPSVGPQIYFNVHYNQRASDQPAVFNYANLGPLWNCDWVSSLTFDTANAYHHRGQGGVEQFSGFDPVTQSYQPGLLLPHRLFKLGNTSYEIRRSDGGKEVFDLPDNPANPTRIFMTSVVDPQGNSATLTYDSSFRLTAITDAIGQMTTLTYGTGSESLLIKKVTDPFGRFASFAYDSSGDLTNITDVLGLTSAFSYSTNDTMQTMVTGYGVTSFSIGTINNNYFVEVTEPNAEKQRVEQGNGPTPGIAFSEPAALIPAGILPFNAYLDGRDTYYWDRKAMAEARGIYSQARLYHFIHQDLNTRSPVLESVRMPSENRVWYNYQGQNSSGFYNYGMYGGAPSKVGVVLDDGQTQLFQTNFNSFGRVTQTVDPLGRTVLYTYATNGIDLLEVRRLTGSGQTARLAAYTWNNAHRPLSVTDMAGQTTTFTYNSQGQVLTVTNPRGEITTLGYSSNYLISIDGPLPGPSDTLALTYDSFGRVRTHTDVDGYSATFDYDALNRLTQVTYPDGTTEQMTYQLLDPGLFQDRRGRNTTYQFDSLRHLTSFTDPLGRTTHWEWCGCGELTGLIDALGRRTQWSRDLLGRVTSKIFSDGTRETSAYDSIGRLKLLTDAKGQTKHFTYELDDALSSVSYGAAQVPTPAVRNVYDPFFPRVVERIDGAGSTKYSYFPITGSPTPGAGQLQFLDGPFPHDTITYTYDELGRIVSRAIDGVLENMAYDPLSRVISSSDPLGSFTYAYVAATPRQASLSFPNGQTTLFDYYPNSGDRRLKEIWNKLSGGATLSKFDYSYDLEGYLTQWTQQRGANRARILVAAHDLADRLAGVTNSNPTRAYAYGYDDANNRLTESIDGVTTRASYNALNELVSLSTNSHPNQTYEWDAENRLVAVNYPGLNQRTEFSYDGLNHCVRIVEKSAGTVTSDKLLVWCDGRICEERDATGAVTKRYFCQGFSVVSGPNAGKYFYAQDHLRSITEVTDLANNIRADYEFDPEGRRTKLSGDLDSDFGFTGYYYHAPSSLQLATFRAYDASLGRWISRDPHPMPELLPEGPNLYAYVRNSPLTLTDPEGLDCPHHRDWWNLLGMAQDAVNDWWADQWAQYEKSLNQH
jgi:RHS repeat-associated protein